MIKSHSDLGMKRQIEFILSGNSHEKLKFRLEFILFFFLILFYF